MSIYNEKIKLYRDYIAELDAIAGRTPMPEGEAEGIAAEYINDDTVKWENIWGGNGKLIGFFITCKSPTRFPHVDYLIDQVYVSPGYRKQGLAKKAVIDFVSHHPGRYCKIMLTANTSAYAFWEDILSCVHAKKREVKEGSVEGEEIICFTVKAKK